jgi:RND superfamily putative drug exporter
LPAPVANNKGRIMALWLYRLGRFSAHRAWVVIATWAVLMGLVGGAAALFMGPMSNNFQIPGTETQQMADKLQADLPEAAGGTGSVVFTSTDGKALTPAQEKAISAALVTVKTVPTVKGTIDPFLTTEGGQAQAAKLGEAIKSQAIGQGQLDAKKAQDAALPAGSPEAAAAAQQNAAKQATLDGQKAGNTIQQRSMEAASGLRLVSENGKAAIGQIQFSESMNAVTPANRQLVQDKLNTLNASGVTVDYSQEIVQDVSSLFGIAEVLGIAVAAAVLIIMLGTLIAAGLPLLMAIIGVGWQWASTTPCSL